MSAFWPNGSKTNKPRRTRGFGYRSSIYKRGWHTGTDTSGYPRNHVPERGVVERCYYDGSYGNTVLVRHHDGVLSRTAHGAAGGFLVGPGQVVEDGQALLVQGTTGMSTGVHNHQEIILPDGTFVDPEQWIPGRGEAPTPAPAGGGGLGWFDTPSDDRQYYYWHYGNALIGNYASNQWLKPGQSLKVVENPGTGPVKVECADGDHVWVGTRNHPARVRGAGTASPAQTAKVEWFSVPEGGQFFYHQLENALRGNYDPDQIFPHVIERDGQTVKLALRVTGDSGQGPRRVLHTNLRDHVWVGTRNNPARTYWA